MKKQVFIYFGLAGVFMTFFLSVRAQPFDLSWFTINGGGGTSTGAVFSVRGTIGQLDAGRLTNGSTIIHGGFWVPVAVQTPGAPLLSIAYTTTNTIAVFWPSPFTGWVLQQNTNDVSSVNWSNASGTIHDDGTTRTFIVNLPTSKRFYRLFKP